uniref:EF-hand domain-containing protein n=1 Tax=Parastrongyloides trichosuri TaxID=131310 RepID=A0A0N4Z6H6_PARTI
MAYNFSLHYAAADALFITLDVDRNGTLTVDELQRGLSNGTTEKFDMDTCALLISIVDKEGVKKINILQFRILYSYLEGWRRSFYRVDRNRSGTVDVREFKECICNMGYNISDTSILIFFQKFARKRRLHLFFDDFIRAVMTLQILTESFKVKDIARQGIITLSFEEFLMIVGQSGMISTMSYNFALHYPAADALFLALDRDRNGFLTMDELQRGLSNGTIDRFDMDTCSLLVSIVDREGSKRVNMGQFRILFSYIEGWRRAFNRVDTNRNGCVEVNEFKQILLYMGYRISDPSILMFIQKFARKRYLGLLFDDFIRAVITLQILTEAFKVKDVAHQGMITLNYEEFLLILGQSGICR